MSDTPMRMDASGALVPLSPAEIAQQQADSAAAVQQQSVPPDCGSLAYWLAALDLWQRKDSNGNVSAASAQVEASIADLIAAKNPAGTLASRQFNNANSVLLADLLKIAPAFGFTAADCTESLWRADRVRQGDLTGAWPLPASA